MTRENKSLYPLLANQSSQVDIADANLYSVWNYKEPKTIDKDNFDPAGLRIAMENTGIRFDLSDKAIRKLAMRKTSGWQGGRGFAMFDAFDGDTKDGMMRIGMWENFARRVCSEHTDPSDNDPTRGFFQGLMDLYEIALGDDRTQEGHGLRVGALKTRIMASQIHYFPRVSAEDMMKIHSRARMPSPDVATMPLEGAVKAFRFLISTDSQRFDLINVERVF